MSIETRKIVKENEESFIMYSYCGLSTEDKPEPQDQASGSTFLEMDTDKAFIYCRINSTWYETNKLTIAI